MNKQQPEALRRSTAADGKTELFNLPGYPLMVRAVDFNRIHTESEMRRAALLDETQKTALAAGQATAAKQTGAVYATLPDESYGSIMGAAYDFRDAHVSGSVNLKRSAHAALETAVRNAISASHGQAPAQAVPQREPVEMPAEIEQMATGRYKVVPSHESMFHRWAVVAGTGAQQLYLGREVECQNMARKFAGAFLDGAFVAMQQAAPQPSPTAQAAPENIRSILARCRDFIDTTKAPAYPAGADLADEIDVLLAAQPAPQPSPAAQEGK